MSKSAQSQSIRPRPGFVRPVRQAKPVSLPEEHKADRKEELPADLPPAHVPELAPTPVLAPVPTPVPPIVKTPPVPEPEKKKEAKESKEEMAVDASEKLTLVQDGGIMVKVSPKDDIPAEIKKSREITSQLLKLADEFELHYGDDFDAFPELQASHSDMLHQAFLASSVENAYAKYEDFVAKHANLRDIVLRYKKRLNGILSANIYKTQAK